MFEKRVSGMFLGELLRVAVLELYQDGLLQPLRSTPAGNLQQAQSGRNNLMQNWSVDSWILSMAQSDTTDTFLSLHKKMSETSRIPEERIRTEEAQAVKMISLAIGRRAVRLAGMEIGSVILQGRLLGAEGSALKGGQEG